MSYSIGHLYDRFWDRLDDACDERLQVLHKTMYDGYGMRAWLRKHGYDGVEAMTRTMIEALTSVSFGIGVNDIYCIDSVDIDSVESGDGVMVPFIRVLAEFKDPGTYEVWGKNYNSCELPCWISNKCFASLTKDHQDYLKSLDYDNLTPKEGYDVYESGNYDVWIEIDFKGKISYHPCDSLD